MNILLIGEYSGVSKNLKQGFTKLGHNATIFSDGDGWKKIKVEGNDVSFNYKENYKLKDSTIRGSWRLKAFIQYFQFKNAVKQFYNTFDFVIIINYEFIRTPWFELSPKFSFLDIKKVLKKKAPIFLMACGDEYPYLTEGKKMRYWPHDCSNLSNSKYFKTRYLSIFKNLHTSISAVVPGMFEYANAYRNCEMANKITIEKTIPFAFDTSKIECYNKLNNNVIKIYHGINREDFKGTPIIKKALEIIKEKYPNKVQIRIEGGMPLAEYINVLKESNIIIDQCKSYSYGMNAIYAMALGKVVFSGNEPECMKEFGRNDIPIINILPEVDDIVAKLETFINAPNLINEYSKKGRAFVEDFHNNIDVASKYIDLYHKYKN